MGDSEGTFDDFAGNIESRIQSLDARHKECKKDCGIIERQMKELADFNTKKHVEGLTLPTTATLVDLLIQRVLDTSADWKDKIDLLINIPHGTEAKDFLRGGDYFEALFQLAIAIGCLPAFKGKPIVFEDIRGYSVISGIKDYLYTKPVQNSGGKEQGVSDITFSVILNASGSASSSFYKCGEIPSPETEVTENPTYFISVKGYKQEKNAAREYDIPLINHQLTSFPERKNKHILVCVRNKAEFEKRLGRSRMGFIRSSVNFVIGYGEVMDALSEFRKDFFVRMGDTDKNVTTITQNVEMLFPKQSKPLKPMLSLYFHQELVSSSVINRIHEIGDQAKPHFMCIGVLPRGGKSYIAGGVIREHMKRRKTPGYNVLFITSAVNETREQFQADLINKFSDFDSFDFVDLVNDKNKNSPNGRNKFMFASRQLVTLSGGKSKPEDDETDTSIASVNIHSKLEEAFGGTPPSFNICFFDEAHIGIGSEKVREQFQTAFEKFKIPIVLMTATYKNPAIVLDSEKDLFVWDLQDVKDMKDLPALKVDGFIDRQPELFSPERYGKYAETLLRNRIQYGEVEEQIARPYIFFPIPNFISLTFKPDVLKHFEDTGTGYTFTKAFEANKDRTSLKDNSKYASWGSLLSSREHAIRLRQFLTPEVDQETDASDKQHGEILVNKDRKFRALNQVFRIAQRTGSRPVAGTPFSILMFLPVSKDKKTNLPPVGELCRIWGSFMLESKYWRDNFVFLTLSTYIAKKQAVVPEPTTQEEWKKAIDKGLFHREDFRSSLKETIQKVERKALEHGKGLVLLSGDVAKMGISLKCVDVVCMMNTTKDADDIIQKMYRALTDDPPTKKNGFIIDLDIKRVVTAMFEYDVRRKPLQRVGDETEVKERLDSIMELCNWGQDAYMEDNRGMTFDDVMNDVRKLVFGNLSQTLHTKEVTNIGKKVIDAQVELLLKNTDIYNKVSAALRNSSISPPSNPLRELQSLLDRGEGVSGEESSAPPGPQAPPPAPQPEPAQEPENPLTGKEIKEKLSNIIQTFINSLVIKSSESWDATMTFDNLISKYKADKLTATRKCSCDTGNDCTGKSANMYDLVYCELRGYAFTPKGEYSARMHESIMNILDEIFQSPESIVPEWSAYVNGLIRELKSKPVGGRRNRTWKKRNHNVKNGRGTIRANHSRYYRKKTSSR
jgi:hypothetical protein